MRREDARRQFAEIATRPDEEIVLDQAALLIAAEDYPSLRIEAYLAALDEFASSAAESFEAEDTSLVRVLKVRDHLFSDLGFSGNRNDYFDARNSFLNEVIDRRMGIPITLSVVLIEVARRLDLKLEGVGMPGHFIVRFNHRDGVVFLDPFNEGREMTKSDCRELITEMYGETLAFHPSFLGGVSHRQILGRMLQNLKSIYTQSNEHSKLFDVVERAILLKPSDAENLRDRAIALIGLGRVPEALADFEEYLRRVPEASDRSEIKKQIGDLRQRQAILN